MYQKKEHGDTVLNILPVPIQQKTKETTIKNYTTNTIQCISPEHTLLAPSHTHSLYKKSTGELYTAQYKLLRHIDTLEELFFVYYTTTIKT